MNHDCSGYSAQVACLYQIQKHEQALASRRFRSWRPRTTPAKSAMSATMLLSRPHIFFIGSFRCGIFASQFHRLKGLTGVLEVVVPQYAHEACDFQNHAALQALKSLQLATPGGHTPGALSRAGGQQVLKNC